MYKRFNSRRVGVATFAIRIVPPLQQMKWSQQRGAHRERRHGRRNRYVYNSNDGLSPVKITPLLLHLRYPPRVETASHVETVGRLLPVHPLKTAEHKGHTRKQPKKSSRRACCTTHIHTARKKNELTTTLWSSSNLTVDPTKQQAQNKLERFSVLYLLLVVAVRVGGERVCGGGAHDLVLLLEQLVHRIIFVVARYRHRQLVCALHSLHLNDQQHVTKTKNGEIIG